MYSLLKKILYAGIIDSLKDNGYAKELLFLLDNQAEIPLSEQLVAINTHNDHITELLDKSYGYNNTTIEDARLLSLSVKGIRKFPANNQLYTISFIDKEKPVSALFLGSNGIGKSSLFSALEYISLGHSYSAEERGFKTDAEQKAFLCNNRSEFNDALIRITSQKKSYNTSVSLRDENVPMLVPPAFFCSEYDIQELSREGLTPYYICKQLGFEQYFFLLGRMRKLRVPIDLNDKFEEQNREIDILQLCIKIMQFLSSIKDEHIAFYDNFIKEEIKPLLKSDSLQQNISTLIEKVDILCNRLPNTDAIIDTELVASIKDFLFGIQSKLDNSERQEVDVVSKRCSEDIDRVFDTWINGIEKLMHSTDSSQHQKRYEYILELSNAIHFLETFKEQNAKLLVSYPLLKYDIADRELFMSTLSYLEEQYKIQLKDTSEIINRIMPDVFKDYFYNDINAITASYNEDSLSLNVAISVDGAIEEQPRKFLNTFRFKMFCFIFKYALACSVKKYHGINFPFIVDDVFDASDFDNRTKIGLLFDNLCDKSGKYLGVEDCPLQLIFFTQDSIIAEAVRRDVYIEEFKLSRLFDIDEVDESTDVICGQEQSEYEYVRIEDRI